MRGMLVTCDLNIWEATARGLPYVVQILDDIASIRLARDT